MHLSLRVGSGRGGALKCPRSTARALPSLRPRPFPLQGEEVSERRRLVISSSSKKGFFLPLPPQNEPGCAQPYNPRLRQTRMYPNSPEFIQVIPLNLPRSHPTEAPVSPPPTPFSPPPTPASPKLVLSYLPSLTCTLSLIQPVPPTCPRPIHQSLALLNLTSAPRSPAMQASLAMK